MQDDTWRKLEEMFFRHPVMRAEAVPYEEIDSCGMQIGFSFPRDYREFLHRYGGAIVGPLPVFGLRRAKPMAKDEGSALEVTQRFRKQGWPGTEGWWVFSIDHGGNPIGLDRGGEVWISDREAGGVQRITASFEAFLRKRCLRLIDVSPSAA